MCEVKTIDTHKLSYFMRYSTLSFYQICSSKDNFKTFRNTSTYYIIYSQCTSVEKVCIQRLGHTKCPSHSPRRPLPPRYLGGLFRIAKDRWVVSGVTPPLVQLKALWDGQSRRAWRLRCWRHLWRAPEKGSRVVEHAATQYCRLRRPCCEMKAKKSVGQQKAS